MTGAVRRAGRVGAELPVGAATVRLAGALLTAQALLVAGYVAVSGTTVLAPRYVLYPAVWITLAVVAVVHAGRTPESATARTRLVAGGVAVAYAVGICWVAGLVGPATTPGVRTILRPLLPGWGPLLAYDGYLVSLRLVPFKLVGYLALGRLLYGRLVAASRPVLGGLVGAVSCVGCTVPLVAPLLAGVGGSAAMAAAATAFSVDLSTLAYLLAVGLLWPRE